MKRRHITEDDKLKEAKASVERVSRLLDEELERWETGCMDRAKLCAGIDVWQASWKEIFRIEKAKREKELKWRPEQPPEDNVQ